jgi:hypothetical protein
MAQVVEHLSSKEKALNFIPQYCKIEREREAAAQALTHR